MTTEQDKRRRGVLFGVGGFMVAFLVFAIYFVKTLLDEEELEDPIWTPPTPVSEMEDVSIRTRGSVGGAIQGGVDAEKPGNMLFTLEEVKAASETLQWSTSKWTALAAQLGTRSQFAEWQIIEAASKVRQIYPDPAHASHVSDGDAAALVGVLV